MKCWFLNYGFCVDSLMNFCFCCMASIQTWWWWCCYLFEYFFSIMYHVLCVFSVNLFPPTETEHWAINLLIYVDSWHRCFNWVKSLATYIAQEPSYINCKLQMGRPMPIMVCIVLYFFTSTRAKSRDRSKSMDGQSKVYVRFFWPLTVSALKTIIIYRNMSVGLVAITITTSPGGGWCTFSNVY